MPSTYALYSAPAKYPASGNACRASLLNGGHPGLRAGIIEAKDAVSVHIASKVRNSKVSQK